MFWQGPHLSSLLQALAIESRCWDESNDIAGPFASTIDDDWLEAQRAVLEEGRSIEKERELIATVALSAEAVQDSDQISFSRKGGDLESSGLLRSV